jgi:hypothetical protein
MVRVEAARRMRKKARVDWMFRPTPGRAGARVGVSCNFAAAALRQNMAEFFVIVRKTNTKLLEILSSAFRHRTGYAVVADRRTDSAERGARERRAPGDPWNGHDFFVADGKLSE